MEPWQQRNEESIKFCRKFEEGDIEGNVFFVYGYLADKKSSEMGPFPTRGRAEEIAASFHFPQDEIYRVVEMDFLQYAKSHDRPIPEKILNQIVPNRIEAKSYHGNLSKDLASWYCYVSDAGHSILCAIKRIYNPYGNPEAFMVPVPVKTVLRVGYEKYYNRYLIVDVQYDNQVGLQVMPEDEEF